VLLIAARTWPGPPILGIQLHVNLLAPEALLIPVQADLAGEHVWPVAYPQFQLPRLFVQYVWVDTVAPLQLSASDALQLH
jgi:hypothetical protein